MEQATNVCANCKQLFKHNTTWQLYCSDKCRQAAHRKRAEDERRRKKAEGSLTWRKRSS